MRKSIIGTLLLALAMLPAAGPALAGDGDGSGVTVTVLNDTKLYTQPQENDAYVKGTLSKGLTITVTNCGGTPFCTLNGPDGTVFVPAKNLDLSDILLPDPMNGGQPDDSPGDAGGVKQVKVLDDVDLYDVPGGEGTTSTFLEKGSMVGLIGCRDDGWCQVTNGWVWGEYLDH